MYSIHIHFEQHLCDNVVSMSCDIDQLQCATCHPLLKNNKKSNTILRKREKKTTCHIVVDQCHMTLTQDVTQMLSINFIQ